MSKRDEFTWTVRVSRSESDRDFQCVVVENGEERCTHIVGTSTAERAAKMALENHLDEDVCGCFDDEDDEDGDLFDEGDDEDGEDGESEER